MVCWKRKVWSCHSRVGKEALRGRSLPCADGSGGDVQHASFASSGCYDIAHGLLGALTVAVVWRLLQQAMISRDSLRHSREVKGETQSETDMATAT